MKETLDVEITLSRPKRVRPKGGTTTATAQLLRVPRIARLMALAIKFQDMVDKGEVRDYADLARLGMVTRARLTQIMNLTLLAPEIQEQILLNTSDELPQTDRKVRGVGGLPLWSEQRLAWQSTTCRQGR